MAAIYDMPPFAAYKWMEENKERLIAAEREMVAKAWDTALEADNGIDPDDYSQELVPASMLGLEYYDRRYVYGK